MISIQTLTTFFGWCTVINLVFIVVVFLFFGVFHEFFGRVMARFFGVSETSAKETLLRVLTQYRVLFVIFNLVPYIALEDHGLITPGCTFYRWFRSCSAARWSVRVFDRPRRATRINTAASVTDGQSLGLELMVGYEPNAAIVGIGLESLVTS